MACGLGWFPSLGLGGMILEAIRMVEEDGAMLSIQSVQLLENSICRPRVDLVHHSAETSFYQQMISWA